MIIITHLLAFTAGAVVVWIFKAQVMAELGALHAKVDSVIVAIKAK